MSFLKLFSCCKIVDGAVNSIIADLQRGNYIVVPKSLSLLINKFESQSIEEIRNEIEEGSLTYFDSYVKFIIDNEMGFTTEDPFSFIYFNNEQDNSFGLNVICEDLSLILNNQNFILELTKINVLAIHITIEDISLKELRLTLEKLMDTSVNYVSSCSNFNKELNSGNLKKIAVEYPIFGEIFFYFSPSKYQITSNELTIHFSDLPNNGVKNCGSISPKYFGCNFSLFSESLSCNSCLNKKIAIDKFGNIKNCPSMSQTFGNIKNISLEKALEKTEFKKYWHVTKDMIEVCKDCEFRYMCTDCRAYTERTHFEGEIDVSKPLKCGYNPYSGEWSEWSTNKIKEKSIEYYGMQDLIKKNA